MIATSVALGDVDGDADLDAFVGTTGSAAYFPYGDYSRLYLNDGAGAFSVANTQLPLAPLQTSAVELADVDGDGDLDGVVGMFNQPGGPLSPPRLYLNDGVGLFTYDPGRFPPQIDPVSSLAQGDVDGDGDLDVLVGTDPYPSTAYYPGPDRLYLNDGAGTFSDGTPQLPPIAALTADVALGDVDGDGDLDAWIANAGPYPSDGQDRLYLNDGAGVFSDATAQIPSILAPTTAVAFVDAEGDGDLDAWIGRRSNFSYLVGSQRNRLCLNDGSGFFSDAAALLPATVDATEELRIGDVDGDGDADAVTLDAGQIRVLFNLTRHLSWHSLPRIGRPLNLDLYGPAWGWWVLAGSLGTGNTPLPPLGVVRLDLGTLILPTSSFFDAQGRAAVTFPVPADPALVGQSLYWQAMVVGPARLTNLETTTFTSL